MFQADRNSKLDYKCFNDVMAFDKTYKNNKYNRQFVIFFFQINHHHNTIIFACALVVNEIEETYTWTLMALLKAMDDKELLLVVIDNDKAMCNATSVFFEKYVIIYALGIWKEMQLLMWVVSSLHELSRIVC